jgi:Arc/MetJ-type ribon-helix-helix transcriptional regulator
MAENRETGETGKGAEAEDAAEEKASEQKGGKQLKEIIDGTARFGQSIGQAFKGMADIFAGRDYVVMVRVNKPSIDKIDDLVQSGLFKSRSESAAFLIARGIQANSEFYSRIEDKVSEINRLKDELRDMIDIE